MTVQLQRAQATTLHGVLLSIMEIGVVITGEPGVGKSSAALELLDRGHALVADDIVAVQRVDQAIIGSCPEPLHDLLKVRGVEIFNIRKLFGDRVIASALPIQLIIALDPAANVAELEEKQDTQTILGISLPRITLPGRHSNVALLLENLVKVYALNTQGYNAQREFIATTYTASGVTL